MPPYFHNNHPFLDCITQAEKICKQKGNVNAVHQHCLTFKQKLAFGDPSLAAAGWRKERAVYTRFSGLANARASSTLANARAIFSKNCINMCFFEMLFTPFIFLILVRNANDEFEVL